MPPRTERRGPKRPIRADPRGGGRGRGRAPAPEGARAAAARRGSSRARPAPKQKPREDLPELEGWLAAELHQKAARHRGADAKRAMQELFAAVETGDAEAAVGAGTKAKGAAPHAPSVREALGLLLYEIGEFKRALSELQAFRRMTGARSHDPRIADCYRALGRPERAVEELESLTRTDVDEETWIEGLIVRAEAMADLGNHDGAVAVLSTGPLEAAEIDDRHRRLWYAYADVLERAGQTREARTWFRRLAVDAPDFADATERAET